MASKLQLRIVTRDGVKLDEPCDMVIMRCATGDMGILPRHMACSAVLDYGALRVINDGSERKIAVFAGLMQVKDDVVTIMTNEAQFPEDIDRARAEADLDIFSRRVQEEVDDIELLKHQAKLRRTFVRMEVSSYPLINPSSKSGGS
jgi:F-type H+-transporting ATPase subunit epsilon